MPKSTPASKTAYDEVPYSSYPFAQTNPAIIRSTASLFGLAAPDYKKSRILELGCASGNNILSIASRYPNSKCVGVDLSEVQIKEGKQRIKDLGIKNLELKQLSILDIDKTFGKFDYIICHGVFSWVPQNVQKKILEICSENLNPDGVAYVSYNTMPGWSAIKALREMMLYHTARFTDPKQKADQARLLLKFIRESLGENNKSTYAEIIESEMNILKNQSDWYLLHDHLEENNTQLYFHQFIEMAAKQGLQYLSEISLSTMFTGNLPKETAKTLATSGDIIRTEQYLDFIYNRRFRSTLLCHKDRILRRHITPESFADSYLVSNFKIPAELENYKFGSDQRISMTSASSNISISTNDSVLIATLLVLAKQKQKPLHIKKLGKLVLAKIKSSGASIQNEGKIDETIGIGLLRAIFCGGIVLHSDDGNQESTPSDKPKAYFVAQYQCQNQDWITNLRQESTRVGLFDKALLPLLNGKNSVEKISDKLLPKFTSGELTMNESGKILSDIKTIEKKLPKFIKTLIERYAELALLEA